MSNFDLFLSSNINEIHLQILQTISILIQNVTKAPQLCTLPRSHPDRVDYILSHKMMNAVIVHDYNFKVEEVAHNYIALLKSLTIRLDDMTLPFFFNDVSIARFMRRNTTDSRCTPAPSSSSTTPNAWSAPLSSPSLSTSIVVPILCTSSA